MFACRVTSSCCLSRPPVNVGGATIATRLLEPTGSPMGDIVLCHGTPWSSYVWGRLARQLARDYRVFLWDMPGYGDSEKGPSTATDLRVQAERLVSLLDIWDAYRPHLVAHDIGGAVALRAHLMHGAEFADLFLWNAVTLDPWGSPFFRLVARSADVFTQLPASLHAALVKEYIAGAVSQHVSRREIEALASPWLDPAGQAAFYRQIAALSAADTRPVAERLGSVRCPTRIGWGNEDPWLPLQQAYELQSRLPGDPHVVVLEGVGHLAPYEDPAAVSGALRQWLARYGVPPIAHR